jgi:hypothetical protein
LLVIEDTARFDASMLFRHVIFDRKSSTPLKRGGTEETEVIFCCSCLPPSSLCLLHSSVFQGGLPFA